MWNGCFSLDFPVRGLHTLTFSIKKYSCEFSAWPWISVSSVCMHSDCTAKDPDVLVWQSEYKPGHSGSLAITALLFAILPEHFPWSLHTQFHTQCCNYYSSLSWIQYTMSCTTQGLYAMASFCTVQKRMHICVSQQVCIPVLLVPECG